MHKAIVVTVPLVGVFTIVVCIISAASPASAQSDENLRRRSDDEGHGLSNRGSVAAGLMLYGVIASIIGVFSYTMIMIAKNAINRARKSTPQANNSATGRGPAKKDDDN